MNDATLMRRYLLGEISGDERDRLEARYFDDARAFAELVDVENVLVDDYVRGRLTPGERRQFETAYAGTPERRDRVRFARSLVAAIDPPASADAGDSAAAGRWAGWLAWMRGPRLVMAVSTAVLVVSVAAWLVVTARPPETTATGPAPATVAPPASGLPGVAPPPPAQPAPVVTFALAVGPGERTTGDGDLPTLTLPPGTGEVRLALTLREHDYARYRAILRAVGGAELLRQGDLVPSADFVRPSFTLAIPASQLPPADYLLTLQGADAAGEYEDLSQTLFRVR